MGLSGCYSTRDNVRAELKEINDYDFYRNFWRLTGFYQVFPDDEMKLQAQEQSMCQHKDAERRSLEVNQLEDTVYQYRCTLGPYPSHTPQRYENRFRK